jgi:hypothetical protein
MASLSCLFFTRIFVKNNYKLMIEFKLNNEQIRAEKWEYNLYMRLSNQKKQTWKRE